MNITKNVADSRRANRTIRIVPASYRPRSNRFPSKREKTLWKKGSRLGNSTIDPTGTPRMGVQKLLFFAPSRGLADGLGAAAVVASPPAPVIRVSHTTVPGIAPCRVLPLPSAPMTSTRPRTVVVATCDVACDVACTRNPVAPAHNIATQINTLLWLIVDAHLSFIASSRGGFLPHRFCPSSQKRTPIMRLRCPALFSPSVIVYVVRCRYSAENNKSERGR